ncbi:beta-ketoacyl-ACP synthase [Emcibacter sp. SYSU 3D8]|uniref:beta-ketoacyl-ACP synthase n=1 Tax=Emcibacter sp. SYSU 3D8 TaxID=3133969 RepID=UPI0031FF3401
MTSGPAVYINAWDVANALGGNRRTVANSLLAGHKGINGTWRVGGRDVPVARLEVEPAALPDDLAPWESRNNRLVLHCLTPLKPQIEAALAKWGPRRLGVIIGTSTSGISETEHALKRRAVTGEWPSGYRYSRQELGDTAAFAARVIGATGPCYAVSTACTSGVRAMISAVRLLRANLCDAVLCGGVDTLCDLTLQGFASLQSLSSGGCNPFSINRDGITIGEGGALFLLSRDESDLRVSGWGESSDAHHFSAPHPEGVGARLAVSDALGRSTYRPGDIAYINLHGTGTALNDSVEAAVMHDIFGPETPCSSTKGMTGHMLGAAGSNEAAFLAIAMTHRKALPHVWDGATDPSLSAIKLATDETVDGRTMLSCSYAFGGNNAAIILTRE